MERRQAEEVRMRWRLRLARFWLARGDLDEAAKHAYRAAASCPPALAVEVALTLARIERDRDNAEASRAHLLRAVSELEAATASAERDAQLVRAMVDLADCDRRAGRWADATPLLHRALAISGGDDTGALTMLGIVAKELGAFSEAFDWYGRAAAIQRRDGAPLDSKAALQHNLAGLAYALQRNEQAEMHARKAVELRRQAPGATDVDVAADLAVLGSAVAGQGRYGEARVLFEEALSACRAARPPRRYEIAVHLHNLAAIDQADGMSEAAEQRYRQTLAMKEELLGGEHPEVALVLNNLGTLLDQQDRAGEATECYERALRIAEPRLPHDHPMVERIRHNLARADR
jgi:tetratricopeptide (TPR) repeat protein